MSCQPQELSSQNVIPMNEMHPPKRSELQGPDQTSCLKVFCITFAFQCSTGGTPVYVFPMVETPDDSGSGLDMS